MRLKNYLQFIKESIEDLEESPWKLTRDEILDFFTEIIDNGYLVDVEFGVVGNYRDKEIFSEQVLSGRDIRPAYLINIIISRNISNVDVTDALKFATSIISELADADYMLYDVSELNIDTIQIKRGIFVNSGDSFRWTINSISVFVKQKGEVSITQSQLSQYYDWSVSFEKDGQLFAEIDLEDMADQILSRSSSHKDPLVKGQEVMWDYYRVSDYYPDINSLFEYTLDSENSKLLVESIIKELGGYLQVINLIRDECSEQVYEKVKDMKEVELVDYLLSERFKKTIEEIGLKTEVMKEVRDVVANWEMGAHCDDNYKEIISEFDRIVKKALGDFHKVEKEVTKHWTTSAGERREYKTEVTYFRIPYSNDWIIDVDIEDLKDKNLNDIFRDWLSEGSFNYEMNPSFSDWGNVDKGELNKDIRSILR
jgi:hypothetical protein